MAGKQKHHSAPKRRNKPHRPRHSATGGGLQLIAAAISRGDVRRERAKPLREDDVSQLSTRYLFALEDLKRGAATEKSWAYVTTALNMALGMAESGIGAEYLADIVPALEAAARARVRGEATGMYRLDGEGIAAITHVLMIHDAQCEVATPDDVLLAEKVIAVRIAEGHVHNPPAVPA